MGMSKTAASGKVAQYKRFVSLFTECQWQQLHWEQPMDWIWDLGWHDSCGKQWGRCRGRFVWPTVKTLRNLVYACRMWCLNWCRVP